ncbi:MAG: PAS domain S-box protein, partial [Sedimentisphaerales bacterium]|nr:PAS domain S-box protein [Sedimentisphaerales bacterium]
ERKKAEEEIRKFKAVSDRAGYGVGMIDLDGHLIYVNDTFAQMHGYHAGELTGKHVSVFHNEEQMKAVNKLNQQLKETGSFLSEEVWHIRKDGTEFCALMNGTLIQDGHGKSQFLAATAVDITRRKNMEMALAESEEKYRTLVECAGESIATIDKDGVLLFANKKAAEELGYQPEDLIGKTMWDLFPKEIADRQAAVIRVVIETGEGKNLVSLSEIKGKHRWYNTTIEPLRNENGRVTTAMIIARDIDHIKQAEERIRTLSSAVEQSIDGIAIGDLNRRLLYVNAAYAHIHGYTPEEMMGMHVSDVRNNKEAEDHTEIAHLIDTQGSWTGQVEHVRKNGTVFPCYLSATSISDDRGEMTGRLVVCRDITESKKREEELKTYREKMARAEQLASLGTLSATIAHQITQPLTVIRLSLDNVIDELEGTSCSSTVLRRLRDSVAQVSGITTIINRFRNYARHSSDTAFGQVNVQEVVVRIARLLAESAKQARVTLNVEDMSALPPVMLHEREFEQILFALVENAIQAADGKKSRRIVISGSMKEEHIELRFTDTCGGIPPESLDKIFEPFFTTKPRGQGTGLGLCIVRNAVARVGGRVRVESELGKGSTFFVTLPICED